MSINQHFSYCGGFQQLDQLTNYFSLDYAAMGQLGGTATTYFVLEFPDAWARIKAAAGKPKAKKPAAESDSSVSSSDGTSTPSESDSPAPSDSKPEP